MLTTNLEKLDKFYISLAFILVLMSVLLILTFRGVFSMFLNATDFDQNAVGLGVRVQSTKLDEATDFVFEKNVITLKQMPIAPTEPAKKAN